jgi:hypothetical protein
MPDTKRIAVRQRVRQIERYIDESQVRAGAVFLDRPANREPRFALAARLEGDEPRHGADRRDVADRLM